MRKTLLQAILIFLLCGLSNAHADQPVDRELAQANTLFSEARYSEALSVYQRVLNSRTSTIPSGFTLTRIGDCQFRLADYQSAIRAYRVALEYQQGSDRAATQFWIGLSTFLLRRDADAVAEFLKIPELYPASGMWVSTAYYWAGKVCEHMGKKEQAAVYYRNAGGTGATTQGRFALKKAETISKEARVR
ncbi:MAG TPA: tetratricopeptide repeat protein [Nitrospirota bacterium]|nr:tetratricopeptide repeat protein [Nitrospirota bacterium]